MPGIVLTPTVPTESGVVAVLPYVARFRLHLHPNNQVVLPFIDRTLQCVQIRVASLRTVDIVFKVCLPFKPRQSKFLFVCVKSVM